MKKLLSTVILISILGRLIALECDMTPKSPEGRLMKDVFCNYDTSIRPVNDSKTTTLVKVKMILKSFDFVSSSANKLYKLFFNMFFFL